MQGAVKAKKSLLKRISFRTFEEDDASFLQPRLLESNYLAIMRKWCVEFRVAYQYWIIGLGTLLLLLIGIQGILSIIIGLLLPHVTTFSIYYYSLLAVLPGETPDLRSPSHFSARWLRSDKNVLYVANLDGDLVATFGIVHRDSATCEAVRVMTINEQRGKGIGSHMIEHVVKQCADKGYKKIILSTSNVQTDAHQLYRSNQFEQTKIEDCGLYKMHHFVRYL